MKGIWKKWTALAAALCLLTGLAAFAEPEALTKDAARTVVEALLAAAAGTSFEEEQRLRASLTEEECLERSAELAAYRERTLPWLCMALAPETSKNASEDWTMEVGYAAMRETAPGRAYLELMRSLGFDGMQACMRGTAEACRAWLAEIDAAALAEINPDYACWLYCPDTPIDYPVVQGADNSRYLHRLFNGESNACGTLFIDCRNLPGFQDPNTLIYGHHMRNGSMFKSITYYADQAWYEAHPYMLLISDREIAVLEMFASCTTSKRDPCYDVAISDADDMRAFVEEVKRRSDFLSGVEVESGDRLVTLSTCAYAFENARCIAVGRIRSAWIAEEDVNVCGDVFEHNTDISPGEHH